MPKITVAIPTFNRCDLIKDAINSVLKQSYSDFELIVVDNASTDKTKEVVGKFKDSRIKYFRNKKNIGMMDNWNKCIELSKGEYLTILGDDDKLLPNFLEKSLKVHLDNKNIGFSFSHCNKVDIKGNVINRWGYKFTPAGLIRGVNYLYYSIKYESCLTNSSTVLINKRVFNKVGKFEAPFGANTFDFNMWIKIAKHYPVYFINQVLSDYRLHSNQVSEVHWRRPERQTGKIGTCLELYGAICYLLTNDKLIGTSKKKLITKRIANISEQLSKLLKDTLVDL